MSLSDVIPARWAPSLVVLLAAPLVDGEAMMAALAVCSLYLTWHLRHQPVETTRLAVTAACGVLTSLASAHQVVLTAAVGALLVVLAGGIALPRSAPGWAVGAAACGAVPALVALADPVAGAIALMVYAAATAWATASGRSGACLDILPAAACAYLIPLAAASDLPGLAAWAMVALPAAGAWAALMVLAAANLPAGTWQAPRAPHDKETNHAH